MPEAAKGRRDPCRSEAGGSGRSACAIGRRSAIAGVAGLAAPGGVRAQDPFANPREAMIGIIAQRASNAGNALDGRDRIDPQVLAAMRRVPRESFVPPDQAASAYDDRPLPIGYGQTISQPFIVALMTNLLRPAPGQTILEVGTGSGYQAAILAELVGAVHSIEIVAPLADAAERRLRALGYANVTVHRGDGYYGVPPAAPFDGIIVTAAAAGIPPPLLDQLRPGGRMVIPVGGAFALQHLVLVGKLPGGQIRTRQTLPVHFVPFVRSAGR